MIRVTLPCPRRTGSFRSLSAAALLSLFGGLSACGGSPTMPPDSPTQSVPLTMERVRPLANTVTASGEWIQHAVRVKGLNSGLPMAGVSVRWNSPTAAVDFARTPWDVPTAGSLTLVTDQGGIATVLARYHAIGTATISASLFGTDTSKVAFTITTTDPPTYVIGFGPQHDCNEPSSFTYNGSSAANLSVPVGAVVEWVYTSGLHQSCTARIESLSVPAGATGFTSGLLGPGQRFRFVFQVAGTWTYVDKVNTGFATLTVVAP